jgi:hypothetical protein
MEATLIRWIIFSVIITLTPLFYNVLRNIGRGKGVNLVKLVANGELLLVSAAISAGALGHLFGSEGTMGRSEILSGGGCVWVLMIATYWFADVSELRESGGGAEKAIATGSLIIFIIAVIAGFFCVLLGQM